jgi:outer membrane protein assembly factor BamB
MIKLLKGAVAAGVLAGTVVAGLSCSSPRTERLGRLTMGLSTTSVTQGGDELRSSWYSDEPNLSPSIVGGSSFGQLFSTAVDGQVYAQPLVWNGTLLIATETNHVYGMDAATGAIRWTQSLGTPFTPNDVACGDLTPNVGITGAPVIDQSSGVAYLLSKTYITLDGGGPTAAWYAHAFDVATGTEKSGFPVLIGGAASNDASQVFNAKTEHQRPGLLLLDGVVYAAFGGHCDFKPYAGWIVGISPAGTITTMWSTQAGPNKTDGAAIWQSGGGLVSDGSGQILFATANGGAPSGSPIPGASPPGSLGESVVRVVVQPDGSLKATDFFAPSNGTTLDTNDSDLGSGGAVALPSSPFGTTAHPHLLFEAGKEGYVYLLDRDNLGGFANGAGGTDNALVRIGPWPGFWSKGAVWPGDGGYVYLMGGSALHVFQYGVDGSGNPSLTRTTFANGFGYGSGAAVVTSNGTQSGSALVWALYEADGSGSGGQLRAYDAVPVSGALNLRFSAAIGTASKFAPPGIAGGRVYVGARDGHVLGFGSPTSSLLR